MIAVIGAGAMGEALMAGWIATGTSPDEIVAVDQDTDRLAKLRRHHQGLGVPQVQTWAEGEAHQRLKRSPR